MTSTTCIKVNNLRKIGFGSLDDWLSDPNNVYVGRKGRNYEGSKWANPFYVKKYGLEKSLKKYTEYLHTSGLIDDIEELRGLNLGCWCVQTRNIDGSPRCHAQILSDMLNNC